MLDGYFKFEGNGKAKVILADSLSDWTSEAIVTSYFTTNEIRYREWEEKFEYNYLIFDEWEIFPEDIVPEYPNEFELDNKMDLPDNIYIERVIEDININWDRIDDSYVSLKEMYQMDEYDRIKDDLIMKERM